MASKPEQQVSARVIDLAGAGEGFVRWLVEAVGTKDGNKLIVIRQGEPPPTGSSTGTRTTKGEQKN